MFVIRLRSLVVGVLIAVSLPKAAQAVDGPRVAKGFHPDAAAVQRFGPAYRYPQAGWIVLHIEGEPYERGYQYGRLLAPEIADYVKALASYRSPKAPAEAWRDLRLLVNALFLRRYEREYLEELKGIADGAAAAGAKFENRPLDLIDLVGVNSGIEVDFLEGNLEATPTGLEGLRFKEPPYARTSPPFPPSPIRRGGSGGEVPPAHCSAFAATGPATADGKIVFGHITMWSLYHVRHFNVWLDVKPAKGHRVLMQTFPGGIMSGMDYYLNDAGLLVAETTINQTKFDINGQSLVSRIRKALQYGDSIDQAVAILGKDNNGVYSNEWLLADTKTNEIAMFELGTHKSKLWRSSKHEWIAGTEGFYWGCNNAKDLQVRLETVPSVEGKPANMVYRPSDRDLAWLRLYHKHKGKISAEFGFEAFTTPPIAGAPSCDAKFTTTALAKELKTWALFGPPMGRSWQPTDEERTKYADIRPLIANDWTLLSGRSPANASEGPVAVDLSGLNVSYEASDEHSAETSPPAWHRTILPKTDADIWLATGFADFERVVALEKSLRAKAKEGKLGQDDQDRVDLALFAARSRYEMARQRLGKEFPLGQTAADPASNDWYDLVAGKGVLMLADLRQHVGAEKFDQAMDDFGRAHAGKEVTTAQFREHLERATGKSLREFLARHYEGKDASPAAGNGDNLSASSRPQSGSGPREAASDHAHLKVPWSVTGYEAEPERCLIVYGTQRERHAQKEAAELLQRRIADGWCNFLIPVKSDREVTEDELKGHHLLLVGRPDGNAIAARCTRDGFPVSFGSGSFAVRNQTYANPASAVIAAGGNPLNRRYSIVVLAGLSAEATYHGVKHLGKGNGPAEVIVLPAGQKPKRLAVPERRPLRVDSQGP